MPTADAPRPSDGVPAFDGAVSSSAGPGLMNGVIENALLETLRAGHEWAFEMMVRPIRRAPPRGCTTANTQRRRHVRRGPIGVPERLPRAEGVRGRLPTIGLAAPNRGQHSPHETAVAAAKARGSDRGNLVGCQTSNRQTCCNPFSERAPDAANVHERFVAWPMGAPASWSLPEICSQPPPGVATVGNNLSIESGNTFEETRIL